MFRILTQRRAVIISFCVIFAVIGVFISLKQLNAQGGMPGMPTGAGSPMMMPGMSGGMPGMMGGGSQSSSSASGAVAPTAPALGFGKVARGVTTKNVRNWDGTLTPILRFKYRLAGKRVITVYLPKSLASEKRTKNGWESLFQTFAMDVEAKIDAEIKNNPTPTSSRTSTGTPGMGGGMMMPGMGSGMPGGMPMLPGMPLR